MGLALRAGKYKPFAGLGSSELPMKDKIVHDPDLKNFGSIIRSCRTFCVNCRASLAHRETRECLPFLCLLWEASQPVQGTMLGFGLRVFCAGYQFEHHECKA